jgi:hypothetical protein
MKKLHLLGAAGVAAGVAYAVRATRKRQSDTELDESKGGSMKSVSEESAPDSTGKSLDDSGTSGEMAIQIIKTLRDRAFEGNDERLALALGRTGEEVKSWFDGAVPVDADALMKARALGNQRNVELPHEPVSA